MHRRYVVGELYRAGARGVIVTWQDGSATTYPARTLFVLEQQPLQIQGRLYRAPNPNLLTYEAPALVPRP